MARVNEARAGRRLIPILLLVVALTASLLATACGSNDSNDSATAGGDSAGGVKPVRIAFFTALGNTYLEATLDGLKEAASKTEDVTITPFDSKFDATQQFKQIQDAITSKKFDAFVIFPVDGNALVPVVKQAADAGIKVIDTDFPIGSDFTTSEPQVDGVVGSVILPANDVGTALGELTIKACGDNDPCKVAEIVGFAGSPFDTAVDKGIKAAIADAPQVDVVATQEGQLLADPAFKAVQNILQAHPDIDVITTVGDQMANGAEKAVAAAGLTGKVETIGEAASVPGVEKVRAGKWFGSIIALPRTEGVLSGEMAIKAVRGGKLADPGVNPVEQQQLPPYISRDNADEIADFKGEWKG